MPKKTTHKHRKHSKKIVLILNKMQCTHTSKYQRASLQQQERSWGLLGSLALVQEGQPDDCRQS
jgi:hypothetical protein